MTTTLADGVSFIAASAGIGDFVLASSRLSFLTLAQAVALSELDDGDTVSYVAQDSLSSPTQREWGHGTFSAGTNTIARTTVLGTVNNGVAGSGSPLNFSVPPTILLTVLAEDIQTLPTFLFTVGGGNTQNFYVSLTGSDSNDGLSPATAWATIQHALIYVAANVNFAGGFVNVNAGAGIFVGAGMASCIGGGFLQIIGAGSSLTTIQAGPNDGILNQAECVSIYEASATALVVDSVTLQPGTNLGSTNALVNAATGSSLYLVRTDTFTSDLIFDNTIGINYCVAAGEFGLCFVIDFSVTHTVNFQGNSCSGMIEVQNVSFYFNVASWQTTGNTNFNTACANVADTGLLSPQQNSFTALSGTITGHRFHVGTGGTIAAADPNVLGPTFFLGSIDGLFADCTGNYDGFYGAQSLAAPPTSATDLQTNDQEATFKDTTNGQRLIAVNDGGSIYVKQICRTINAQTGSYTVDLPDQDGVVRIADAGANTLTVPQDSAFVTGIPPVGTEIRVTQAGAGATTVAAGAGATVNNAGALVQWQTVVLRKVAANTWDQTNV